MQFTALFEKVPEGYIAFVEELSGANTQATTSERGDERSADGGGWRGMPVLPIWQVGKMCSVILAESKSESAPPPLSLRHDVIEP